MIIILFIFIFGVLIIPTAIYRESFVFNCTVYYSRLSFNYIIWPWGFFSGSSAFGWFDPVIYSNPTTGCVVSQPTLVPLYMLFFTIVNGFLITFSAISINIIKKGRENRKIRQFGYLDLFSYIFILSSIGEIIVTFILYKSFIPGPGAVYSLIMAIFFYVFLGKARIQQPLVIKISSRDEELEFRRPDPEKLNDPLEILKLTLARGEITKEEFNKRKRELITKDYN